MTRTLNIARRLPPTRISFKRRGSIEPAVVERTARNGAGELLGARLQQRAHVVERGKPAGGDHRNGQRIGKRDGGVDVEALEHAVARDVGIDDRGNAGVLEAPGDIERGKLRASRPSLEPRPCRRAHRARPRRGREISSRPP